MDSEDDDVADVNELTLLKEYVSHHVFLLVYIGVLCICVAGAVVLGYLPYSSYHVYGNIEKIESAGVTVRIFHVDVDVSPALNDTLMVADSGLCSLAGWSAQCFIGAPVEVTVSVNRFGQNFRSVTAIVRGSIGYVEG
jgi:hypothetical protein